MNTSRARYLIAAAVLATLAACGNKGPLVKPSAAQAPASEVAPAVLPTDAPSPQETPVAPVDAPESTIPPVTPPADDSGGNG